MWGGGAAAAEGDDGAEGVEDGFWGETGEDGAECWEAGADYPESGFDGGPDYEGVVVVWGGGEGGKLVGVSGG